MNLNYAYSFGTDDSVKVYIPVRAYELTLTNRLLDQLGGFSHLILEAMKQLPTEGIEWVEHVTGLNFTQLQPIIQRLEGLGLMSRGKLSIRGEKITAWKNSLHNQTRLIWLDGNHKSHSFFADNALEPETLPEDTSFIIRSWHRANSTPRAWSCHDWNEDCQRQKNRILSHPTTYLEKVFDNFKESFIDGGFPYQEWDLNVRLVENSTRMAIGVTLNNADIHQHQQAEFVLFSPVLCLSTRYSLPKDAPRYLDTEIPQTLTRTLSLGNHPVTFSQLLEKPLSDWIWQEMDTELRTEAIDFLYQTLGSNNESSEKWFNREHFLSERWQRLSFDLNTLKLRMERTGVHFIQENV
ncbi:hypothetical protein [Serratia fonticola]|uniref:hypothetical protein n=1 Tax=Serratia fonticola TaxID=47917 RepID=UPI00217A2848|nr:hypothetical protein [Serratia fonticola]CAI1210085.1 Uncharacterised protein [Serratia fonticola]